VVDVVLREMVSVDGEQASELKLEILQMCHAGLAAHKVPAMIRIVPALDVAAAGKLARPRA
jgi:acyl-coenzyme A synthetase/AMP-(fatty) acid ligase